MHKPQHIAWLSGWGLPSAYTEQLAKKQWPDRQHSVILPTPQWQAQLSAHKADLIIAHSLGSLLLLNEVPPLAPKLICCAPIIAFPQEAQQGGRIHRSQLKLLLKQLRHDPLAALNHFYRSADIPLHIDCLPYPHEDLSWGIHQLNQQQVVNPNLQTQHHYLLAGQDSLLDAQVLQDLLPQADTLAQATHHLADFLPRICELISD